MWVNKTRSIKGRNRNRGCPSPEIGLSFEFSCGMSKATATWDSPGPTIGLDCCKESRAEAQTTMDASRAREKFRRLSGGLRINPVRLGVGVTENNAAIAGGGDLRPRVNHGFDGNQRTVMEEGSWTSE